MVATDDGKPAPTPGSPRTVKLGLVPDEPADAGPRLRVAVASQDGKTMNAHFGSAKRFMVYEVTPTKSELAEVVTFEDTSDESGTHDSEGDRLGPKVKALTGCNLLFVLAIGGPAAARVVSARIHPVKLAEPESIEQVLNKVKALMTGQPPPWLRKALALSRPPRTDDWDDEEDAT